MPEWHCRLAVAGAPPEKCEGIRHRDCGLRYPAGEFRLDGGRLWLPGIGTIPIEGAAFAPKAPAAVIVTNGADGWHAEFEDTP